MAAIAIITCQAIFPGSAFLDIGWRIPFFFSAVLIIIGLYIRLRILETPGFAKINAENRLSRSPFTEVFKYRWREVVETSVALPTTHSSFNISTIIYESTIV